MKNLNKYIVYQNENIRDAIKKMDEGGIGFVVCVGKNENVIGVISDGDFRRAVLSGISLDENVLKITNKDFKYLTKGYLKKDATDLFRDTVVQHIPVLENGKLVEIITEEAFYDIRGDEKSINVLNIPVVIMAGGKGTRLDPFTRILPKPLIPLGDKTMIEIIMYEYAKHGMRKFYISINHKGRMIKAFLANYNIDYEIKYINESKPLGTAGALKYLENKAYSPFFVSNCDVIIRADYSMIYKYHVEKGYLITLVASMQHHTIPYGVCKIEEGGLLKEIVEKPGNDILVNAGMYLLNPEVIPLIPENESFDMTDLINKMQSLNMPIGVFPVSADSWLDVGQWKEYTKSVKNIKGEGDN